MQRIAVIGSIGSGKSTVLELIRARGYSTLDADDVARDVVEPGTTGWKRLVDVFGTAVLDSSGHIDRQLLATLVFRSPEDRRRVNALLHPLIGEEMKRQLDQSVGDVCAVAIPLFRPEHRTELELTEVWGVFTHTENALRRLREQRGMTMQDAQARLVTQMGDEERRKLVDRSFFNDGDVSELTKQIDYALSEVVR